VLDVQPAGQGQYRYTPRGDWSARPVVEASQLLAQVIVAASREAPGRRAVAASMAFPRAADATSPYSIDLEPVSVGRTFACFGARAVQGDRTCGVGTVLLDVTADSVIAHSERIDVGAGPDGAVPFDMGVTGRDLRIVDGAYTGDPDAPVGPPELDAWVRFDTVPDDPAIHAALLAQFTGHLSVGAALRPHAGIGEDQAHVTLSCAINAISLSLHADVRADEWMLYRHRSTFAGDGMSHAECRVHDERGVLLASFTVDAMVRTFDDPNRGDARTAL
jgi:acyl-CoA thioesterase-2